MSSAASHQAAEVINALALLRAAVDIANRAVIADIQSECVAVPLGEHTWWDITTMVSPQEHAPQVVDQAQQALQWALDTKLIERHHEFAHLVRITHRP